MNYALGYFVFYYPMHDAHSRPVRNVLHVSLTIFVNSPDINKCDRNLILDSAGEEVSRTQIKLCTHYSYIYYYYYYNINQ